MADIFDEVLTEIKNAPKGDIFDEVLSEVKSKGGEPANEEQEQNQSQADSDRNAGREADQQVAPVGSQTGIQADGMLRPQDQGQRQRDDQTYLKDEGQTEDAQGGIQGSKAGKVLGSQVPARNKEEVVTQGVQSPKGFVQQVKEAGESVYKGLGTFASEAQQYAFDLAKIPLLGNAETAEAVFGPNAFSDKIRKGVIEKGDKYFSDLVAASKMTADEAKSPLNQFMFGVGHMVGDLIPAVATAGATAEESALVKATELPIWKTIGQKAINGMKDFSVPALISANSKIDEEKKAGKTDSEALASGMKSLIETEAGAAIPMQVSSGLENIFMRGASRVLQSMPLAVAQSEMAKMAGNVISKESDRTPTITENIIAGKFDEAAQELAQVAPMGLIGIRGERARPIKEAGLPATAAVLEGVGIKPSTESVGGLKTSEKPAEAPAKAQPTTPSETKEQIQETGGIPAVEGEPTIGKTEVKAEERTPQGERKGEEEIGTESGERLVHAAFKPDLEKPETFYGANHDEALNAAHKAGAITDEYKEQMSGNKNAANRNTENFGYLTDKDRFVNRKEGYQIGKESDQLIRDKFDFEGKEGVDLHSHEVVLDEHPLSGKIDAEQFNGKTVKSVLYNLSKDKNVHPAFKEMANVLRKGGFLRPLQDLVITTKEVGEGQQARGAWVSTGYVFMPKGEPVTLKTLFHEILHSHTSHQIAQFVQASGKTGKDYYNAILTARGDIKTPKELKNIIDQYLKVVDHAGLTEEIFSENGQANNGERMRELKDKGALYGHTSLHEFISEAFTNPEFQDILKSIPHDSKFSVWDKILENLAKLLKIPANSVAYDVMKSSLDLSKRPSYLAKRGGPSIAEFRKEREAAMKQIEEDQIPNQFSGEKDQIESIGAGAPPPELNEANSWWEDKKQKTGMFMSDMKALGVPGASKYLKEKKKNLFQKTGQAVVDFGDSLGGKTLIKLRNAGVFYEGVEHARNSSYIEPWVNSTIAEVFPTKYKISEEGKAEIAEADFKLERAEKLLKIEEYRGVPQKGMTKKEYEDYKDSLRAKVDAAKIEVELAKEKHDKIKPVIDIIVKDNILGGLDDINANIASKTKELEDLKAKFASGAGDKSTKSEISALEENIADLEMASKAITDEHDVEKYAKDVEAAEGTEIETDINRWKEVMHPIMDELYKKANNTEFIPPTERGRVFGARINLLSKQDSKRFINSAEDEPLDSVIGSEYRNPDLKKDVLAKRAAFTGEYSTDIEAILKNSFASRYREGTKLSFYKALIQKGEAVLADPKDPPPTDKWVGQKVKRMAISDWPEYDEKTGRVTRTEKVLYLPNELYPEVNQILDASMKPEKNKLFDAFTSIQLAAPTDAIVHSKNLLASVTTALGRDSAYKDIINKIPILNSKNAIVEIRNVMRELDMDDAKIRKDKADIARFAGLRPHFESEKGVLKYLSKPQHDFLYKTDLAVRVIMNRRFDNLVKRGLVDDTPEARADFINTIGEYNRKVMARWEASLRDKGFSPFIVAGRAMNRMGRRLITADPGFQPKNTKAQIEARLIQASGLAMAALVPALINLITTKSFWGRPGTPIGSIDFGPNFDTEDGKHRGFDFFQLMNIRRGARQLGIDAAINGIKDGASFNQIFANIEDDVKTVSLHPFVGPGIGFAIAAVMGQRFDLRSGFQGVYLTRKIEGPLGVVEKARVALKQQNQFLYGLGFGWGVEKGMEVFGIPRPSDSESETLRDLGLPQHVPIFRQLYDLGVTAAGAAGGRMYVTPAMKYVSQLGKHVQYSPKDEERYILRKAITDAEKAGDKAEAASMKKEAKKSGKLTIADLRNLAQKKKYPDLLVQRTIRNITNPEDAISLYRVATAEEQDKIDAIIKRKIQTSTKLNKAERRMFLEQMNEFAKEGSKRYSHGTAK